MVAALHRAAELRPMTTQDLDAVLAIERAAYDFPWTRGIFEDCLRSGYRAWIGGRGVMVCGYGLLACGAGEAHVLNLCVAQGERRHGLGRRLLETLLADARRGGAVRVFLEVRPSNVHAVTLYHDRGFNLITRRPNYYPAHNGREDALVMALELLSD
jgi:[ribosomal protein S18]-alanine N-acetyltransferase